MTLALDGLSHRYGSERAVDDVSFELEEGELVALLGPSGCGKTTVVQAVAGHVTPTDGRVRLRGADVTDAPPENRDVGVVFQQPTLFPHMTVGENVAYGLDAREIGGDRLDETVEEYLELVELADQRESRPAALSGGQRRRAELARALAPEPDVLLLDEPLSALDRTLRTQLREEIGRIQRETGVTTLFVTHDQEEAMSVADRLVILRDGAVSAVGTPRRLYESPPNRFVASFLGRSNVLSAPVATTDPPALRIGETTVQFEAAANSTGGDSTEEDSPTADSPTADSPASGNDRTVQFRPADAVVSRSERPATDVRVSGVVRSVTDVGRRYDVTVQLDSGERFIVERRGSPPRTGDRVTVGVDAADLTVLPRSDDE